jgi:type IV fimbrial biogenesis protein FimT
MDQSGKTLPEMMIVVGIVSVLAVFTPEGFLGVTLKNQALAVRAELAGELRMARHLAITRHEAIAVRIEQGGTSSRTEPTRVQSGTLRTFDFSRRGVVVGSVSNKSPLVFYATGRAATPTTIVLRHEYDGAQYPLTVSITGQVNIK